MPGHPPAGGPGVTDVLVATVRDAGRDVLAGLTREVGDLALAEDAVQDAVVRALEKWPQDGVPDRPAAWLRVVARNRARDLTRVAARRGAREERVHRESERLDASESEEDGEVSSEVLHDDLLRLLFTCCHPSLAPASRVALALRTLCGLSEEEIARALLTSPDAVAKRLVRTRQKIRTAAIPYRVPDEADLPERWSAVVATVYLLFNEGHTATAGPDLLRPTLIAQALRLARLLRELRPTDISACGLLALILLHESRRPARVDAHGDPVLLPEQDRTRWDHDLAVEGVDLVATGIRLSAERPGSMVDPYLAQAAIAACHVMAPSYAETDWGAIISWYDALRAVDHSPVVALNRAIAVAERDGAAEGLRLVDGISGLDDYPLWHATRGALLRRLGRTQEAYDAEIVARGLPLPDPTRRLLDRTE